jgi:ankyrin repeat protein
MKGEALHSSEFSGSTLPRHAKVELVVVVGLLVAICTLFLLNKGFWTGTSVRQYADQLRQAVLRGEIEKVENFLSQGIYDADSSTDSGWTILMDAVTAGHREMAALLLRYLANPSTVFKDTGDSALAMAINKNREDIARLLLLYGADVDAVDANGNNVLMAAIRRGLAEFSRLVMPKTTNLNQTDSKGNTALMLASERGLLPVVKLLLNQEVPLLTTNQRGETALSLAVQGGYLDIVQALLAAGAKIGKELDIAATNYDKAMVRQLLERGAPISRDSISRLVEKAERLNDQEFLSFLQRFGITRSVLSP